MIQAELISLSNGQSYRNVDIYEEVQNPHQAFQNYFLQFNHNLDTIFVHFVNIKVIKLSSQRFRPKLSTTKADRLIIDGDVIYENVDILNDCEQNIPTIFGTEDGIIEQIAFTNKEGLFIIRCANVASLILKDAGSLEIRPVDCSQYKSYKCSKNLATTKIRNKNLG